MAELYLYFKCEDEEDDGEPMGPVFIMERGKLPELKPYNPAKEETEWVTLAEAHRRAIELGLVLEVL